MTAHPKSLPSRLETFFCPGVRRFFRGNPVLRVLIALASVSITSEIQLASVLAQTRTQAGFSPTDKVSPNPSPQHREMQDHVGKIVQQALEKRVEGDRNAARDLLNRAVSLLPDFAPAHWQLGEVWRNGRWLSLDDIQKHSASDKFLGEYILQRDEAARTSGVLWLAAPPNVKLPDPAAAYLSLPIERTRYLRKSFEIADRPKEAELRIQSVGNCDVFINGRPALQSVSHRLTGTERVQAQLRPGKNVIAIAVSGVDSERVPRIRVRMDSVTAAQEVLSIRSDATWRVSVEGEKGWRDLEFDDRAWEPADLITGILDDLETPTAMPGSPLLEQALARWCDTHKLPEQARFHWIRSLQLQPQNNEALKALGLVRHGDSLVSKDRLESVKAAERDAKSAFNHWQPLLRKALADFEGGSTQRAAAARAKLKEGGLSAIPAFEAVLQETDANGAPSFTRAFIEEVLDRLPQSDATTALSHLAVGHPAKSVRDAAIEALKPRELLDFVPELMGALESPVLLQASVRQEDDGTAVCEANYLRKGTVLDDARTETYRFEPRGQGDQKGPVEKQARDRVLTNAKQKREELKQDVDIQNEGLAAKNERILAVLRLVCGQDLGDKPDAWWSWWKDFNELLNPKQNPVRRSEFFNTEYLRLANRDCFARGTPVWTLTGLRPIETIKVGDAVLAQDQETGELAFKIVLDTSIRPASPMTSVRVGNETITSTRGHRFWKEGQGWRMAKNLQAGDTLHGVRQSLTIDEVCEAPDEPAYNLIVDGFNSYFVGNQAILVHDTGAPIPTLASIPGYRR